MKKYIPVLSFIIAVIALILSQLRPLYEYIEKPKFNVSLSPQLHVTHYLGNVNLSPFIQIRNSGKASGTIKRIELYVENKDNPNYRIKLPAYSYFLQPTSTATGQVPTQIPIGQITLDSNKSWQYFLSCFFPFSKKEQATASGLLNEVNTQIQEQLVPDDLILKYIDDDLFNRIASFTKDRLNKFDIGEYYLLLMVWSDGNNNPEIKKLFTFTVFSSDIDRMNEITELYKSGAGLIYTAPNRLGFMAKISEINDKNLLTKVVNNFNRL